MVSPDDPQPAILVGGVGSLEDVTGAGSCVPPPPPLRSDNDTRSTGSVQFDTPDYSPANMQMSVGFCLRHQLHLRPNEYYHHHSHERPNFSSPPAGRSLSATLTRTSMPALAPSTQAKIPDHVGFSPAHAGMQLTWFLLSVWLQSHDDSAFCARPGRLPPLANM
ncbi:hypothetical protein F4810DRAFT_679804 [Camillea tinctor]|nr:hypothetical protein F4810DRAFT_679804 [Camillea tinctor]